MAAAAPTPLPIPTALPSPRSPTLSDAGMILPEADSLRCSSPGPYMQRPPSPPSLYAHSNRSAATLKLAQAPQGRRGASPLSSQSSRSTLRNMSDSGSETKKRRLRDEALASSPTINDALSRQPSRNWDAQLQQRGSDESSSVHSEDLVGMKWPNFDSHGGFDDSGVVLEEEEDKEDDDDDDDDEPNEHESSGQERHSSPEDARGDNDAENDQWFNGNSDSDDDMYSSAALSRRAEIILANAKRRLNVMEGNLRGARQSLVVSPTNSTAKMQAELSHQLSAARERDRRLYAGRGPIPPRMQSYRSSPLSPNGSPGHARGLSETSVPLPFSPTYMTRTVPNKRASSAMGIASAPWSPEGYGNGRFPIRGSRSFEVMRDPRNGLAHDERDHSLGSYSRGSRSPPNALETLPEDDSPKLHRSASTTSSLRDQMDSLKGRISSLKQKAQEDNMRRRSLQSLRTPSPFTSADVWYSGADAYKSGGPPVTADAGVGATTESPITKAVYEEERNGSSTPKLVDSQLPDDTRYSYSATPVSDQPARDTGDDPVDAYMEAQELFEEAGIETEEDLADTEDGDFVSVGNGEEDDAEVGGSSVYEDAVYEMPASERHEDRVDAFDYEHFFLHSAMGTYGMESRRSSSASSSQSSTATTRPVTAILNSEDSGSSTRRVSMHQRNSSVDSVSTMASFATAAEEQSDDEEENEQMDRFSQQIMKQHGAATRHTSPSGTLSPRSDSAVKMHRPNGPPTQTSQRSGGSSPGADLVTGLQTSKIFSIVLESPTQVEPRLALNEEEKQLIYSLASSFQQVCANLQSTAGDQYERKEWRRRLDEARRVLTGEEVEGQPF